jgi:small subunit ribosomal protein S20
MYYLLLSKNGGFTMPNLKSAVKQLKKSKKRYLRNKSVKSELKTRIKKLEELIADKKIDEAQKYIKIVIKRFDQAASKNIIHKNKASRYISKLQKKLNQALSTT